MSRGSAGLTYERAAAEVGCGAAIAAAALLAIISVVPPMSRRCLVAPTRRRSQVLDAIVLVDPAAAAAAAAASATSSGAAAAAAAGPVAVVNPANRGRESDADDEETAWGDDDIPATTPPPTRGLSSVFDPFARARSRAAEDSTTTTIPPSAVEISRSAIKQRLLNSSKSPASGTVAPGRDRPLDSLERPRTVAGVRARPKSPRAVTAAAGSRRPRLQPLNSPLK